MIKKIKYEILLILLLCPLLTAVSINTPTENTYATQISITCTNDQTNLTKLSVYTNQSTTFTQKVQNTSQVTTNYEFTNIDLPEGTYLYACVIDDTLFSENRTITKDTTTPTLTFSTISNSSTTVAINYLAQDRHLNTCFYNVNNGANTTINNCANTSVTLSAGTQTITLFAQDKAGNTASQSQTITITQDVTAPTIGELKVEQERISKEEVMVTIFATTNENATCKYDNFDENYVDMEDSFDHTGATKHNTSLTYSTEVAKILYVRCKDVAGNKMTSSEEIEYEVTIGAEAILNEDKGRYTYTQIFVEEDETITIDIDDEKYLTKQVKIKVKKALEEVEVKIKELDKKPSALPKLENEVIKFIKFTTTNLENEDIDSATILIKTQDQIYAYNGETWEQLETQIIGEDTLVEINELNYLAITTTAQATRTEEETIEETTNETTQEEPEKKFEWNIDTKELLWWFSIIGLIVVLAGLTYFFKQHKKEFYGED